jgi:Methyltransferase FkbM domain
VILRKLRTAALLMAEACVLRGSSKLLPSLSALVAELLIAHPQARLVQIGASDGQAGDPLHPFVKAGLLRGVLVEALPDAFVRLQVTHRDTPGVTLVNRVIAISDAPSVPFYRIKPEFLAQVPGGDQLSGLTPRAIRRGLAGRFPNIDAMIETVALPASTFAALLAEFDLHDAEILSIDAEGSDGAILAGIDFTRFTPRIVHYEWCHLQLEEHLRTLAMLARHGYALARTGTDVIGQRRMS